MTSKVIHRIKGSGKDSSCRVAPSDYSEGARTEPDAPVSCIKCGRPHLMRESCTFRLMSGIWKRRHGQFLDQLSPVNPQRLGFTKTILVAAL
jgi:hypothetical protein